MNLTDESGMKTSPGFGIYFFQDIHFFPPYHYRMCGMGLKVWSQNIN
jgi:hypothetical protein